MPKVVRFFKNRTLFGIRALWWLFFCLAVLIHLILTPVSSWAGPAHSSVSNSSSIGTTRPSTPDAKTDQPYANSGETLIEQGRNLYRATNYADAARLLEQATQVFEQEQLPLNLALTHSYLALTYNRLGDRQAAQASIQRSRTILTDYQTNHSLASAPSTTDPRALQTVQASVFNASGHLHLNWGDYDAALSDWRDADASYQALEDCIGHIGSKLNQAQALQLMGHMAQASHLLEECAEFLDDSFGDDTINIELQAIGHWKLGATYQLVGRLEDAKSELEKSVSIIQDAELGSFQDKVELDLANTFRAMGERAIAIRNYDSAIGSLQRAMQTYDAIERRQSAGDRLLPVLTQTQLNHLSLALDIRDWSSTVSDRTKQAEWATLAADLPVESLTRSASEALPQLSLNRNTLYARLNFIHSLLRQSSSQPLATVHQIEADASSWEEAIARLLVSVYQDTQQLKDAKVESLALGRLGALYEKQNQLEAAWSTTTQALSISQALYADELSYQWQWQLGRLLNAQDRYDESLEAFQQAVQLLESIRSNLRFIDTDVQFSFRDSVEPVYREYLELLLRTDNAVSPSADNLRQAVFSVNDLQLTELENFLSCSLGNDTSGVSIVGSRQGERTEQNLFQLDPNAAIFHPILLADRLVTILELPTDDGIIISKEIDVPQDEIESVLKRLRTNLGASPDRIPNVKADAQIVYRWLIEPFAEQLDQAQINTLVFVLDGPLRNIPMGVLFDGETYLLDRYSIAIAPQIELLAPQPLQDSLRIFTGGIGEEQNIGDREFEKIENLIAELDGIREISDAASPLVGADFTKEKLEERLTAERFSAIHIKTHGVFSSDPEETFIVASNELIKSHDLGNLIRLSTRNNETPIELLVLSACSTAEGDDRAVLGLAGVAVQAGVNSAVSTLWDAQDLPNTQLMIQFHQYLEDGMSRADALRRAQLYLREIGYAEPFFWAPYVLIGSWL